MMSEHKDSRNNPCLLHHQTTSRATDGQDSFRTFDGEDETSLFSVSKKQKLVLVTLVKQLMDQLDEVTTRKRQGADHSKSMEVFREMCVVLAHIPAHLQEAYFELLPLLLKGESARSHSSRYCEEYVELSIPVKRKFIEEAKEALK